MDKRNAVLSAAFEALEKELKKDPVSPERVVAISEAIRALNGVNPLLQL